MERKTLRKSWVQAACFESLLASLQFWGSLVHEKLAGSKPWSGILHVSKTVRVSGEFYGWASRAHRVKNLTWCRALHEALLMALRWGQVQTQEYLFPFHFPFPALLLSKFVELMVFVTKAGDIIGLCELLCSLSLSFFPQLLRKSEHNEDHLFLVFSEEQHQVCNSLSPSQRIPARGSWNVATWLYCRTGSTHQLSSEYADVKVRTISSLDVIVFFFFFFE